MLIDSVKVKVASTRENSPEAVPSHVRPSLRNYTYASPSYPWVSMLPATDPSASTRSQIASPPLSPPPTSSRLSPKFHPYAAVSRPVVFVDFRDSAEPMEAPSSGFSSEIRPKRKKITKEQLAHLVSIFEQVQTPDFDIRETVSKEIGMTNREVQVWFQNRRAKMHRQANKSRSPPSIALALASVGNPFGALQLSGMSPAKSSSSKEDQNREQQVLEWRSRSSSSSFLHPIPYANRSSAASHRRNYPSPPSTSISTNHAPLPSLDPLTIPPTPPSFNISPPCPSHFLPQAFSATSPTFAHETPTPPLSSVGSSFSWQSSTSTSATSISSSLTSFFPPTLPHASPFPSPASPRETLDSLSLPSLSLPSLPSLSLPSLSLPPTHRRTSSSPHFTHNIHLPSLQGLVDTPAGISCGYFSAPTSPAEVRSGWLGSPPPLPSRTVVDRGVTALVNGRGGGARCKGLVLEEGREDR